MKKEICIFIFLILVFSIFSGCIEKEKKEKTTDLDGNTNPVAIISAPLQAFFGEKIKFDASESFDSNDEIITYKWDFRDGEKSEGRQVEHIFNFENNYSIEYPLIYTVLLNIQDDEGNVNLIEHQIMLFPAVYSFYFNLNSIEIDKPVFDEEKISPIGVFNPTEELIYELENCINLKKCIWNATIFIKKNLLAFINKISFTIHNSLGQEISKSDINFKRLDIWQDKEIFFQGKIDRNDNFKFLKITIYGFTLSKEITILYGGIDASNLNFIFN